MEKRAGELKMHIVNDLIVGYSFATSFAANYFNVFYCPAYNWCVIKNKLCPRYSLYTQLGPAGIAPCARYL